LIPEKEFYAFLRENQHLKSLIGGQVYFGEAPSGIKEPYVILYGISPGKVQNIAGFPFLQLNCFQVDQFKVIELAEAVVTELDGYVGPFGGIYTDKCKAQRLRPLRNEDGTWMCPVEIKFSYLEV